MKKLCILVCCLSMIFMALPSSAASNVILTSHSYESTHTGKWLKSNSKAVLGPTSLASFYTITPGSYVNYSLKRIDKGLYNIYYYSTKYGTTAEKAEIEIGHSGKTVTQGSYNPKSVNDKTWVALGSYNLTGQNSDYVRITLPEGQNGGCLRSAAIRIERNLTGVITPMPNKVSEDAGGEDPIDTGELIIPDGGSVMLGGEEQCFSLSSADHWIESGVPMPTNQKGYFSSTKNSWGKWMLNFSSPQTNLTVWYLRAAAGSNEDSALDVQVFASGRTTVKAIDFTADENAWVKLGTFDFKGDGSDFVKVTRTAALADTYSRITAIKIGYETAEQKEDELYKNSVYNGTDKEILQRLSMFEGEGEITNEYINTAITRFDMAEFVLKLNGLYDKASKFNSADNFSDIQIGSRYYKILAYIKANPQLGILGTSENKFEPDKVAEAKDYAKILLEMMGYKIDEDYVHDDVISAANSKGISIADSGAFTIDALASATADALFAKRKGEERTLLGYIVAVREGVDEPIYTNSSVFTDEMKQKRNAAKNKDRTLIYNNDGNDAYVEYDYYPAPFDIGRVTEPMTVKNFLSKRTAGLENTQMDSLFYCTGVFNSYHHDSNIAELRQRDWAPIFLESGTDSMRLMINWCKENDKEFMWSMRMNDVHDAAYEEKDLSLWKQENVNRLMSNKSEAAINLRYGSSYWSGVDYTHRAVRQRVYDILREVVINYDIDGVELDFSRVEVYFKEVLKSKDAHPETLELMNDVLRKLRTLTEQVSMRRGKPILVAVHVPDSLGFAKAIGLDIEQWLREDLIDIVSVRTYGAIQTLAETKAEYEQYDLPLYLVMDPLAWAGSKAFDWNKEAAIAYHEGFRGVQVYNMYNPQSDLFNTLGSAETCGGYDASYVSAYNPYARVGNFVKDGVSRFLTFGQ